MTCLAITGCTGFVGRVTLEKALTAGHLVRALTRRPQVDHGALEWVTGSLEDHAALDALVQGADTVIHIAGVVNAPDRARFEAGNATGTANVIAAMQRAGVPRLVHVSSLAAREPELSDYGWSKAQAERHVEASGLDWTMVRPPAIYGPGDAELLELFQMASRGFVLLPPSGRLSVIHVDDLADLLVQLSSHEGGESRDKVYEVDDGRPDGWSHVEFARAIGQAVGRPSVRTISMPSALVRLGARIDRLLRGDNARLTPDRAAYFCHEDWVSTPGLQPAPSIWTPSTPTQQGLAMTATVYREKGHLGRR